MKSTGFPTPEDILDCEIATLRTAGLSQRKAEYIQGLAEKFASGELSTRILLNASDQELVQRLTAVRGLGLWSVEMFACFALKRVDVFSTGDLGVQYVGPFFSSLLVFRWLTSMKQTRVCGIHGSRRQ